jgi:hypothetical protein
MDKIYPAPVEFGANQLADDPILQFFHYAHLPASLQATSARFGKLAEFIVTELPRNAERSSALRKLLEAKDCAVRANVGAAPAETFVDRLVRDRLVREHRELGAKLDKLSAFVDGPDFDKLGARDRQLLIDQRACMDGYFAVLSERVMAFTPPPVTAENYDSRFVNRMAERKETVDVGDDKEGVITGPAPAESDPPFGSTSRDHDGLADWVR